jgi:hypothetical protein
LLAAPASLSHESFLLQVSTLKQEMGADLDPPLMRRLLFHGTSAVEAIVNSVDGHGFLPLLAGTSTWGNGPEFAVQEAMICM